MVFWELKLGEKHTPLGMGMIEAPYMTPKKTPSFLLYHDREHCLRKYYHSVGNIVYRMIFMYTIKTSWYQINRLE